MPLLEIVQTTHVNATIRLDESTATQVDQYAAFLHAPADEVVDKALAYVFSKDRDFQDFLRTPEAEVALAEMGFSTVEKQCRQQGIWSMIASNRPFASIWGPR